MKDGRAIIVTGTPGTGKTNFSRLLASKLGIDKISVTVFARGHKLIRGYDRKRRTYLVDERKLKRELEKHVEHSKRRVVLEGHYSHCLLPTRLVDFVFVLRCSPEVLWKRLRRRGYTSAKIRENIEAEILDVCLSEAVASYGLRKVAELNTSDRSIENCVKKALLILEKERGQVGDHDWLGALEKEGKLTRFLGERTVPWRKRSS